MIDDAESPVPAPAQDAWLESLLRDDALQAPYIDDDGFTARLMTALPPPRSRKNHGWIIFGMTVLGVLIGGVWLHGVAAFLHEFFNLLGGKPVSLNGLTAFLAPVAVFYWLSISAALE